MKRILLGVATAVAALMSFPTLTQANQGTLIRPAGMMIQDTLVRMPACYQELFGMGLILCDLPHPDGSVRRVWIDDPRIFEGINFALISDFYSDEFMEEGETDGWVGKIWFVPGTFADYVVQWFIPNCRRGATRTTTHKNPVYSGTHEWVCL